MPATVENVLRISEEREATWLTDLEVSTVFQAHLPPCLNSAMFPNFHFPNVEQELAAS